VTPRRLLLVLCVMATVGVLPEAAGAEYDHPAQADDLNVKLVPDFRQTISATQCRARGGSPSTHGSPLALPSCSPPALIPGAVAHFGRQAAASVDMHGFSCPACDLIYNANVFFTVKMSDIRASSATSSDYDPNPSGADVTVSSRWRLTDQGNDTPGQPCAPYSCPATTADFDFPVPVDCAATADPVVGASCSADTSTNALIPGSLEAARATVIQNFRVRAADSGPDGVRGNSDDRTFAMQGIYIP
jgi:hypothetical protein